MPHSLNVINIILNYTILTPPFILSMWVPIRIMGGVSVVSEVSELLA